MLTSLRGLDKQNSSSELEESKPPREYDRSVAKSVGRCIMLRRTLCGLSRSQMGAKLGIDASDVEAYEHGTKRISAKLLLEAVGILRVRPVFFFQ